MESVVRSRSDCLIDRRCIISTALKRQKHHEMNTEQTEALPGAAAGCDDRPESSGADPAGEQPLTAEAVEELKAQAAKAKESYEQLLRTSADFDNYRKRAARERQ